VYNEAARKVRPYSAQEARDDSGLFAPRHPGFFRNPIRLAAFRDVFQDPTVGELEMDRRLRSAALSFARAHPAYVLEVGGWNLYRLLDLEGPWFDRLALYRIGMAWGPLPVAMSASFAVVALLALIGAASGRARGSPGFLWLLPVLLVVSVLFLWGDLRYRALVEPFLVLLAAAGLVGLVDAARARRGRRASPRRDGGAEARP
jgi:hypothetical protein